MEISLAAESLAQEGFVVLPYVSSDPVLAKRLEELASQGRAAEAIEMGADAALVNTAVAVGGRSCTNDRVCPFQPTVEAASKGGRI
jgi:thiazole synthase ThiGH ThiG subunit